MASGPRATLRNPVTQPELANDDAVTLFGCSPYSGPIVELVGTNYQALFGLNKGLALKSAKNILPLGG